MSRLVLLEEVSTFVKWSLRVLKGVCLCRFGKESTQCNNLAIKRPEIMHDFRFIHVDNSHNFFRVGFNSSRRDHESDNLSDVTLKKYLVGFSFILYFLRMTNISWRSGYHLLN